MAKFEYRALQVIIDDSGEWLLSDEAIKEEFEVDAMSSTEAMELGNSKISELHPTVPLSRFLTGVSW